jgi:hypothetical protein
LWLRISFWVWLAVDTIVFDERVTCDCLDARLNVCKFAFVVWWVMGSFVDKQFSLAYTALGRDCIFDKVFIASFAWIVGGG